ncbi:hypothetical protein [Alysiella filiformis]|uniref:hypothetical protein n=1 Tax=Alysiella filiformis TaxID=194196 RepID=UPI0015F4818B|nr:hypothetical protein [Alysiella filiformis]QMT30670.1 hypothetical protein H3L97_07925 [Alysiella filiformis]UBQ56352.1 hypothetical protein JF568_00765 [Alysiella filiformis DSM 16848]
MGESWREGLLGEEPSPQSSLSIGRGSAVGWQVISGSLKQYFSNKNKEKSK